MPASWFSLGGTIGQPAKLSQLQSLDNTQMMVSPGILCSELFAWILIHSRPMLISNGLRLDGTLSVFYDSMFVGRTMTCDLKCKSLTSLY